MSNATTISDSLMTKKNVAEFLQCTVRNVDLMVKAGRLPRPVHIGVSSPRWERTSLMDWLNRLQAADSSVSQDD